MDELMSIGLVVGGSITIPHVRRAYDLWDELAKDQAKKSV
jgi:shikimate 5-dehydrogenase